MKKFGAMLVLAFAAQVGLADPAAARTNEIAIVSEVPVAAVVARLADVEADMNKLAEQKVRRSVEESIERSIASNGGLRDVTVEITMAF